MMANALLYRHHLPADVIAAIPPYPYETAELKRFTATLKSHEPTLLRQDRLVKIRTIMVSLLGVIGLLGVCYAQPTLTPIGWTPSFGDPDMWAWAQLIGPILLLLNMARVSFRLMKNNPATGFVHHLIGTLILILAVVGMVIS